MTEFIEENSRTIDFNIEEIPDSLTYKLPEVEWTYSPERFGIGEYLNIEYYERMFERKHPGLLKQFPMLYFMVENWHREATKKTPLDEIEERKNK